MPAYWLARAKIIDPVEYKKYNDAARAVWHRFPRRVLARCGRCEVVKGESILWRYVVQEFQSFEAANNCFYSPEYQEGAKLRRVSGNINELVVVEGFTEAQ